MKGPMMILAAAVLLLLAVAYLAQERPAQQRIGSKAYHMLLLGFMRLDIALAQGLGYVQQLFALICKSYHPAGLEERIAGRRQRMDEYRKVTLGGSEYRRRKNYRRKIME
ncbi:MAG: hypothetical protein Q4C65_10785 [Eubacteriales bacterium]|nr:hypothetical protein [Eubacteriales bacterium]